MEKTILLTNDDGINAKGLIVLADKLSDLGRVIVVAPDREQSASSHAITLDAPLRVTEYSDVRYGVSGTPTDCVILAVHGLLKSRPDLIVSGINHGPNMGEDVTYSGTVAAAIEGNILGINSLAISIASWEPKHFESAARAAKYLAVKALSLKKDAKALWNINVPDLPIDQIKGYKITKLGSRIYNDVIIKKKDPRGKDYFWIGGGEPGWNKEKNTDFAAISSGYISITPLRLDLTDYKSIVEIKAKRFRWKVK